MKKPDTTLRDIYQATGSSSPDENGSQSVQETVLQEIRRRQIYNFFVGLLTVVLLVSLTVMVIKVYVPHKTLEKPVTKKQAFIAGYTLPDDELWALEYHLAAAQLDVGETPGEKPVSSKWIKDVAYRCIMGDQAFRAGNWPTAQRYFEQALDSFPGLLGIHNALGAAYLNQRFFGKAAEQLELALKENPSVDVLNNLGAAYVGTGRYEEAEPLLKEALLQNPDLAGCYKNLALLYRNAGRTNDAVAEFETYLKREPKDTGFLRMYADYQVQAGRLNELIGFLEQMAGGDPATIQLLIAETAARNNDADRAVRALSEAARFMTPRQVIVALHGDIFKGIADTAPFKALMHQMEMASVTSSGRLSPENQP